MLYDQAVTSTRYVGWSVCHEEVAEEIFKLIEVIILLHSLTSLFQIWFQRPTFLHPESTPPKKPWIFIGFAFFCWQFQPSITGTPGPGAHYHVDNVDLPSWQVNLILKNKMLFLVTEITLTTLRYNWGVWRPGGSDLLLSVGCPVMERLRPASILGTSSLSTQIFGSILPR